MLVSLKIRASFRGKHVSGSERIVPFSVVNKAIDKLCNKTKNKNVDYISFKVKPIKEKPILVEKTLKIERIEFRTYEEANQKAVELLSSITGIKKEKLKELINLVHTGASPDRENMRGAMIVNQNCERIEIDRYRGVRTVNVDYIHRRSVLRKLLEKGLTERTLDALALTTKNMLYPYMIAEYCISDEPDYTTGYISTKDTYYRFTPLKEKGNPKGGRIYFVKNNIDINDFYRFLQEKPVLIKDINL